MILKKLIIENMFAYQGKVIIDLEPESDKNIILIGARNGRGKTSFLRIIRILLHGLKDNSEFTKKDMKLTETEYAIGKDKIWSGIFYNNNSNIYTASVTGFFRFENKDLVLHRKFKKFKHSFQEEVSLYSNRINQTNPQEFLNNVLPKNFADFFFFDGEKIHELMESKNTNIKDSLEVLLNIKTYEKLNDNIKKIKREFETETKDSPTVSKIEELINKLEGTVKNIKVNQEYIAQNKKAIDSFNQEIIYIDEKLVELVSDNKIDIKPLKLQKEKLEKELVQLKSYLSGKIKGVDFLILMTENLSRNYLEKLEDDKVDYELDEQLKAIDKALNSFVSQMENTLFENVPPEHNMKFSQSRFYKRRIRDEAEKILLEFEENSSNQDQQIIYYHEDDKKLLNSVFEDKISIYEKLTRFKYIEQELKSVSEQFEFATIDASQNSEEIKELKSEKDSFEIDKSLKEQETGKYLKNIENKRSEGQALKNEIRLLKDKLRLSKPILNSLDLTNKLISFFESFKHTLLEQKISALETVFNQYLQDFAFDDRWIKKASINKSFEINLIGFNNQELSISSLASGQKQILATALIQSLGEVSQVKSFICIDTPLARIDLENRKAIVENYYPKASKQVILLSTNSEIDPSKSDYRNLQQHIAKEYTIISEDYKSSFEKGYFNEIERG